MIKKILQNHNLESNKNVVAMYDHKLGEILSQGETVLDHAVNEEGFDRDALIDMLEWQHDIN